MKIRAIIVDDELNALNTLESILLEYCSNITIINQTTSPVTAIEIIKKEKPDLLFLDIDMPQMNGFQLLKSLPDKDFEVIFITASNHHAIEAFKVNAVDYILKPIDISEVIRAVSKVENNIKNAKLNQTKYIKLLNRLESNQAKKIAIPTSSGVELVDPDDIICVEASNNYSIFYIVNDRKIIVSKTLGDVEKFLSSDEFLRIHKASIINLKQIESYNLAKSGGDIAMKNGKKLVVSRRKKQEFVSKMENYFRKF